MSGFTSIFYYNGGRTSYVDFTFSIGTWVVFVAAVSFSIPSVPCIVYVGYYGDGNIDHLGYSIVVPNNSYTISKHINGNNGIIRFTYAATAFLICRGFSMNDI